MALAKCTHDGDFQRYSTRAWYPPFGISGAWLLRTVHCTVFKEVHVPYQQSSRSPVIQNLHLSNSYPKWIKHQHRTSSYQMVSHLSTSIYSKHAGATGRLEIKMTSPLHMRKHPHHPLRRVVPMRLIQLQQRPEI
jgi:hypothetical protein